MARLDPVATADGRRGAGVVFAGAAVLYAAIAVARAGHWSDLSRSNAAHGGRVRPAPDAGVAATVRVTRWDMRRCGAVCAANHAASPDSRC